MHRLGRCLRWQASSYGAPTSTHLCRSRLAGEEARKPCSAWAGAFAGKPAPSHPRSANERFNN
nr:hypothetical protein FFPRI1PSEUD_25580 [Pseudomonas sp. FFPRI_1]